MLWSRLQSRGASVSFIDTGNITSGIDFGSIIRSALSSALGGGLMDKATGSYNVAPMVKDPTQPQTLPGPGGPPAASPLSGVDLSGLQKFLVGLPGGGAIPPAAGAGGAAAAPSGYNPNDDSTYTQRYAGGGKLSDKTIMATPQSLPGLNLLPESAANPTKGWGPSYQALTDQGDVVATLMAQPGAKTELIDPQTGQVVAEGLGQQGSQEIASLATALSQKLGKKAAWDIAQETGANTGQFQTFYGDRIDKPRFTLLSALKMILPAAVALIPGLGPALGGALGLSGSVGSGVGSGIAAGLTGLAEGEKPLQALLGGLGAGAGGFFGAGGFGGAAGGGGDALTSSIGADVLTEGGMSGLDPILSGAGFFGPAATFGAGGVDLLGGLGSLAGSGLSSFGGNLGSVLGNGLNNVSGLSGGAGGGAGAAGGGFTVDPLTVTGQAPGAAGGAGAGGAGGALGSFGGTPPGYTEVSPVEVDGKPPSQGPTVTPAPVPNVSGLTPSPAGGLQVDGLKDPNTQPQQNPHAGKLIQDLLKNLLHRGGGGAGAAGGQGGGHSTVTDPFTPGGGSPPVPPSGGGRPENNPSTPSQPGGGGPSIHATSPSFSNPAMTAPPLATKNSPFGGGAGPGGLGNINLKGSAAPDIYPWQTVV